MYRHPVLMMTATIHWLLHRKKSYLRFTSVSSFSSRQLPPPPLNYKGVMSMINLKKKLIQENPNVFDWNFVEWDKISQHGYLYENTSLEPPPSLRPCPHPAIIYAVLSVQLSFLVHYLPTPSCSSVMWQCRDPGSRDANLVNAQNYARIPRAHLICAPRQIWKGARSLLNKWGAAGWEGCAFEHGGGMRHLIPPKLLKLVFQVFCIIL